MLLYICKVIEEEIKMEEQTLNKKIEEVVLKNINTTMINLSTLQQECEEVKVFKTPTELVKYLQRQAKNNIEALSSSPELKAALQIDKTGGVLDISNQTKLVEKVYDSDISEPQGQCYLAQKPKSQTIDNKIKMAVVQAIDEYILEWQSAIGRLSIRNADVFKALAYMHEEQLHALKQLRSSYKQIRQFDSEDEIIKYLQNLAHSKDNILMKVDSNYVLSDNFYIAKTNHHYYLAEN